MLSKSESPANVCAEPRRPSATESTQLVNAVGSSARLAGSCLPDTRNKTLRPCRVCGVFVAKLLDHHPLLGADTKRQEDNECDQVRRTCHPVRDDECLANGIQDQRRVHRVADPAIHSLRDESMP